MELPRFNIRVYGLWLNDQDQILVSDERLGDFKFTKFPGGGLEYGEGTKECLKREWKEELNLNIEVGDHFYTTDFFQSSAFHTDTQIVSIYYLVKPIDPPKFEVQTIKHNFSLQGHEEVLFRWINLKDLHDETVDLPIDKVVVNKLLSM
jgi:8-oxo-dGTP diphosphatase